MKILNKESGKIFGVPLLQPQAVQDEWEKWRKEQSICYDIIAGIILLPLAFYIAVLIVKELSMFTTAFTFSGDILNLHSIINLKDITMLSLIIWLIYMMILSRQYNKQAPEELKRR